MISPLREEDIPALVVIENQSFSLPKSESVFRNDQNKYLVAKEEGEVLGYIGIEDISGERHIINMAVDPGKREMGIGKRLVEAILNDTSKAVLLKNHHKADEFTPHADFVIENLDETIPIIESKRATSPQRARSQHRKNNNEKN